MFVHQNIIIKTFYYILCAMQFWHLIFVAFFANYSLRKATECVDKGKLRPSFDEIFGKGWDEEEKKQQKMNKLPWENVGQMGEGNGIDQMNDNDKMDIDVQKGKDRSDQKKRVIIEKFELIKKKLREIGQFPCKKSAKIERQIGGQLGVSRDKIYKWKSEFGMKIRNNKHYYEKKRKEFIERLDEFKGMLRKKIAEELGISERTLRKWKRQMGTGTVRKSFSDQEKRETIEKFRLIKKKLKEIGKFPSKKRNKIEQQIAKHLGTCRNKMYKWKREFGKSRKTNKKENYYYKQKKREFIERMDEFKGMLREGKQKKIAEELGISGRTIQRWKEEFGMKNYRKYYSKKCFSVQQKREAIEKFRLIKEKLKEIGQFPCKKSAKIERQIARQLGTNRDKIHTWKREFFMDRKNYYAKKKLKLAKRLMEFKGLLKKENQKIAEELGISGRTLREWKREMGQGQQMGVQNMTKRFSDREKRVIIEKFRLIKEKLKDIGKFPREKRWKIEHQIARQLGTNRSKIYKWKKEL